MKILKRIIVLIGALLPALSSMATGRYDIIPYPANLIPREGKFLFSEGQTIGITDNAEVRKIADCFASKLASASGIKLTVATSPQADIIFSFDDSIKSEGYRLDIATDKIELSASSPVGFFYGVQTLCQLLPPEIQSQSVGRESVEWSAACAEIDDSPQYAFRGMMLDVARYFVSKEYVMGFLDRMAEQKMNVFHWHLTDDQGWRIEIKQYPRLTETGAYRSSTQTDFKTHHAPIIYDSVPRDGFYTQDDIREIVAYAGERFITVIPEIDMPGHTSAMVAAYPELTCGLKDRYEVVRAFGIFDNVLCPTEQTFEFLINMLVEIKELFPSGYIHIGGDECPKTAWEQCPKCQALVKQTGLSSVDELQSYFMNRVTRIVDSLGMRAIGWDEILDGSMAPRNTIVASWRGTKGGVKAACSGHSVIMVPNGSTYLNYYQEDPEYAPVGSGGFLTMEHIYKYDYTAAMKGYDDKLWGVESCVWTPYMPNEASMDYYIYPRIFAFAESAWLPKSRRNYTSFLDRLEQHLIRTDLLGIGSCRNYYDTYIDGNYNKRRSQYEIRVTKMYPRGEIRYTLDGSTPDNASPLYTEAIGVTKDTYIKSAVFENGKMVGRITQKHFYVNKATGKETFANVDYRYRPDNPGANESIQYNFCGLTNGIKGYLTHTHPWVAFKATESTEIVVDLERIETVGRVKYSVLNGYGAEAVAPRYAEIELSTDGKKYRKAADKSFDYDIENRWQMFDHDFRFKEKKARYVKITLKNGTLPYGLAGYPIPVSREGGLGLVFIDEIEIY